MHLWVQQYVNKSSLCGSSKTSRTKLFLHTIHICQELGFDAQNTQSDLLLVSSKLELTKSIEIKYCELKIKNQENFLERYQNLLQQFKPKLNSKLKALVIDHDQAQVLRGHLAHTPHKRLMILSLDEYLGKWSSTS
ncbi:UNKNOWN [Stylonychia lemnae]|uniref:Uncharacterized protein n=1 Tax=Stylonychia lemnae TaxID=5949 RepID=A0A077ZS19_STYLE|nr:UNKNOWN [Stylonychia lemnae]|eukprot:CDW72698.1 UNKNOWN [Stylonychia lemnae]